MARQLLPDEAQAFRTLRLLALKTEPRAFGSTHEVEAGWPDAQFADRLRTSHVVGAFVGSTLVSVAGFRRQDGARMAHKGFVWGVFTHPAHRRRGLAATAMAALLAAADGTVEQLTLTVVQGEAAPLALYRRLGFTPYGTEPRALKTPDGYLDEVLMVRFRPAAAP